MTAPQRLAVRIIGTDADEPMLVDVPTFVIQRHPVTFAQWFEFLDALRRSEPDAVERHVSTADLVVGGVLMGRLADRFATWYLCMAGMGVAAAACVFLALTMGAPGIWMVVAYLAALAAVIGWENALHVAAGLAILAALLWFGIRVSR